VLGSVAPVLDGVGRALCPRLAGVILVEAEKDIFAALPAGEAKVRRRVLAGVPG